MNKALAFSFVIILAASCTDPRIKEIEQFELQYFDARKKGEFEEAIAITRSIQNLDPNEVAHLDTLALLYLEMGEFEAAKNVADSAIQLIPIVSTVKVAITCAKQLRHYADGEEYSHLLLRLEEPESAELLFDLAWFQYNRRNYKNCLGTLEKILSEPKFQYSTKLEEVIQNDKTYTVQMPLWAVCYNMIGACQYSLGAVENARNAFQMSLKIYPAYQASIDNLKQLEVSN